MLAQISIDGPVLIILILSLTALLIYYKTQHVAIDISAG